jgi:hypothetical protein
MKERPILFSAPMVRALLDGSKTQTRRAAKLPHMNPLGKWEPVSWGGPDGGRTREGQAVPLQQVIGHSRTGELIGCPYGQPGDRLWVREAFAIESTQDYEGDPGIVPALGPVKWQDDDGYRLIPRYRASEPDTLLMIAPSEKDDVGMRWKPSIHMPRWASRLLLEITEVRVERLQDISQTDARAEGAPPSHPSIDAVSRDFGHPDFSRSWYAQLWDQINGAGAWAANPWVWAVSFKRITDAGKREAS